LSKHSDLNTEQQIKLYAINSFVCAGNSYVPIKLFAELLSKNNRAENEAHIKRKSETPNIEMNPLKSARKQMLTKNF